MIKLVIVIGILFLLLIPAACIVGETTTSTSNQEYSQYRLEYRLVQKYPDIFWCDPDYYPVSREGQEQANALEQFSNIKNNTDEFAAILEHINLPNKTNYSDLEKLSIYKEHKLLSYAISINRSGSIYNFVLRVGENAGKRIEGTITSKGQTEVLKEETSYNTCPICLTEGTLISTPTGLAPVEQLTVGMLVWTQNESGEFAARPILKTSSTAVPAGFKVIKLRLADGRTLTASPGHPSSAMIPLSAYKNSDILDGSVIVRLEQESYDGNFTYDLLPAGPTGFYIANGILIGSTLVR
jgi:hypothetical protein